MYGNSLESLPSRSSVDQESQSLFGDSAAVEEEAGERAATAPQHSLWVDKYAPRHYTHLLSDDVGLNQASQSVCVYMYIL